MLFCNGSREILQDRILLETDGPYAKDRGRPARPNGLKDVAAALGFVWGTDLAATTKIVHDVFNTLLELEGRDPEFARAYAAESARIEAIDSIINALDEARGTEKLSKAALARAIGSDPSSVRRLLSSESVNPTLSTVAEVAAALGMNVTLTPMSEDERTRITEPVRACA